MQQLNQNNAQTHSLSTRLPYMMEMECFLNRDLTFNGHTVAFYEEFSDARQYVGIREIKKIEIIEGKGLGFSSDFFRIRPEIGRYCDLAWNRGLIKFTKHGNSVAFCRFKLKDKPKVLSICASVLKAVENDSW